MKAFFGTFYLTVAEQRTIFVVLLAFVALLAAKKYRDGAFAHRAAVVQPSPSPGARP